MILDDMKYIAKDLASVPLELADRFARVPGIRAMVRHERCNGCTACVRKGFCRFGAIEMNDKRRTWTWLPRLRTVHPPVQKGRLHSRGPPAARGDGYAPANRRQDHRTDEVTTEQGDSPFPGRRSNGEKRGLKGLRGLDEI